MLLHPCTVVLRLSLDYGITLSRDEVSWVIEFFAQYLISTLLREKGSDTMDYQWEGEEKDTCDALREEAQEISEWQVERALKFLADLKKDKAAYNAMHYESHKKEKAAYNAMHYESHKKEKAAYNAMHYASHKKEKAAYTADRKKDKAAYDAAKTAAQPKVRGVLCACVCACMNECTSMNVDLQDNERLISSDLSHSLSLISLLLAHLLVRRSQGGR
jgi:hypothetical protein